MLIELGVQMLHESESWKRVLVFLSDENAHLKNRLGSLLKSNFDSIVLTKAQEFQEDFLKSDELINMLQKDIGEFDHLLLDKESDGSSFIHQLVSKFKELAGKIRAAEKHLFNIQIKFDNYLIKKFQARIN